MVGSLGTGFGVWSGPRSEQTAMLTQREGGSPGWCCVEPFLESQTQHLSPCTPFIQAVVYEAPEFQGQSWEVSRDIYNLQQPEDSQSPQLTSVGSLRILGGW